MDVALGKVSGVRVLNGKVVCESVHIRKYKINEGRWAGKNMCDINTNITKIGDEEMWLL